MTKLAAETRHAMLRRRSGGRVRNTSVIQLLKVLTAFELQLVWCSFASRIQVATTPPPSNIRQIFKESSSFHYYFEAKCVTLH